jgi:hypothetical protein
MSVMTVSASVAVGERPFVGRRGCSGESVELIRFRISKAHDNGQEATRCFAIFGKQGSWNTASAKRLWNRSSRSLAQQAHHVARATRYRKGTSEYVVEPGKQMHGDWAAAADNGGKYDRWMLGPNATGHWYDFVVTADSADSF